MNKIYSNLKSLLVTAHTKSRRILFEHAMTLYHNH
jgi:hypothetical protein